MKITTVRYRRLQSHDRGYGHDAVEAEAQVDEGEDAEVAFDAVKSWVLRRLETTREADHHIDQLQSLRERVTSESQRLERIRAEVKDGQEVIRKHEKLADLAREHGIEIDPVQLDVLDSSVPF